MHTPDQVIECIREYTATLTEQVRADWLATKDLGPAAEAVSHMSSEPTWASVYASVIHRAIDQTADVDSSESGQDPILDTNNTLRESKWLSAHEGRIKLSARRFGLILDAALRAGVIDQKDVSSEVIYEFLAQSVVIEAILHPTTATPQESYPPATYISPSEVAETVRRYERKGVERGAIATLLPLARTHRVNFARLMDRAILARSMSWQNRRR